MTFKNFNKSASSQSSVRNAQIEGIVDYAVVHSPKKKFDFKDKQTTDLKDLEYSIKFRVDSEEVEDALLAIFKENNISTSVLNPKAKTIDSRIKTDKEGNKFIQFKRAAVNSLGKAVRIDVVDADGSPIPKNILIGNGSRVILHLIAYDIKGEGVIRLSGIQVLDLVEVTSTTRFAKVAGGFKTSSLSKEALSASVQEEDDGFSGSSASSPHTEF